MASHPQGETSPGESPGAEPSDSDHAPSGHAAPAFDPRLTEQRFRLLVDDSPMGVWLSEPVKGVVYTNRRFQEQLGISAEEALGFGLVDLVHPDDQAGLIEGIYRLWVDHVPYDAELRARRQADERLIHARARVVVDDGAAVGVVGTTEDVTLRRRNEQVRRQLVEHLLEMADREREKLSADLHNGPAQDLAAARIMLERIEQRVGDEELRRDTAAVRALVEQTAGRLRLMMDELDPPELQTQGLAAAVGAYAREMTSRGGIRVEVVDLLVAEPSRDLRDLAYLVVQDALAAIRRSSAAERVEVELRDDAGSLRITVSEHAGGVAPAVLESSVYGRAWVASLQHRAESAGGRCELRIEPGAGRVVVVTLPLDFVAEPRPPRR